MGDFPMAKAALAALLVVLAGVIALPLQEDGAVEAIELSATPVMSEADMERKAQATAQAAAFRQAAAAAEAKARAIVPGGHLGEKRGTEVKPGKKKAEKKAAPKTEEKPRKAKKMKAAAKKPTMVNAKKAEADAVLVKVKKAEKFRKIARHHLKKEGKPIPAALKKGGMQKSEKIVDHAEKAAQKQAKTMDSAASLEMNSAVQDAANTEKEVDVGVNTKLTKVLSQSTDVDKAQISAVQKAKAVAADLKAVMAELKGNKKVAPAGQLELIPRGPLLWWTWE